jgi:hypothetical protein
MASAVVRLLEKRRLPAGAEQLAVVGFFSRVRMRRIADAWESPSLYRREDMSVAVEEGARKRLGYKLLSSGQTAQVSQGRPQQPRSALMDLKSLTIGTVVGGITVFATGFLLFSVPPLSDFYAYALGAGSATGVQRDAPLVWAALIGALSYGALVTLAIGSRAGQTSVPAGMRTGAIVGFLLWFTANFMFFAISNVGTTVSTAIGPLLELVPGAFAGGVIATVLPGR